MLLQHRTLFSHTVLLTVAMLFSLNVLAQDGPKVGLRVLDVIPNGLAQQAGLQAMDIIVEYGEMPVVDAASYFVARDQYLKSSPVKVEIDYWRGNQKLTATVSSGIPGIKFSEYNPAAYQLEALMQRLNAAIEVSPLTGDASRRTNPARDELTAAVEAAITKAAAEGLLTPAQVLVARISAVADDAPAPAIERQAELLKELVSTQPRSFTDYLGYEVFFRHKRYRASVPCFKRTLEVDRGNANSRLNLGIAYSNLDMFAESEAAADYALKGDVSLNEHGYVVAFQVKALAALGLREFPKAIKYAEQGFNLSPSSQYLMLLWELAAAQSGDLEKFYEATAAVEKKLPKESADLRPLTDVAEAYVLFRNGQFEKAQSLARKRAGDLASGSYWRRYPTGEEVWKVWKQLQGQN